MSIRVINHVWGNSKQQGSALLVLLAIADWARDDGHNAYPTIPMLAEKARLSHRSVQRIIANLEESGELVIQRSTGRGHAHVYSVPMDIKGDILSPDKDDAPSLNDKDDADIKGDTGGIERVTSATERVTSDAIKGDTPRITNRYLTVTNRHLTVRGKPTYRRTHRPIGSKSYQDFQSSKSPCPTPRHGYPRRAYPPTWPRPPLTESRTSSLDLRIKAAIRGRHSRIGRGKMPCLPGPVRRPKYSRSTRPTSWR